MGGRFIAVMVGMFYMVVVVMVCACVLGLTLYFTDLREGNLDGYVLGCHLLALLVGGFYAGRFSGEKGWSVGGLSGLLYGIMISLIGSALFTWEWQMIVWIYLVVAFLTAAVGGMVGVARVRS